VDKNIILEILLAQQGKVALLCEFGFIAKLKPACKWTLPLLRRIQFGHTNHIYFENQSFIYS